MLTTYSNNPVGFFLPRRLTSAGNTVTEKWRVRLYTIQCCVILKSAVPCGAQSSAYAHLSRYMLSSRVELMEEVGSLITELENTWIHNILRPLKKGHVCEYGLIIGRGKLNRYLHMPHEGT